MDHQSLASEHCAIVRLHANMSAFLPFPSPSSLPPSSVLGVPTQGLAHVKHTPLTMLPTTPFLYFLRCGGHLGVEPRALYMLGKYPTTELRSQPFSDILLSYAKELILRNKS